jgi:hypothetical protein
VRNPVLRVIQVAAGCTTAILARLRATLELFGFAFCPVLLDRTPERAGVL